MRDFKVKLIQMKNEAKSLESMSKDIADIREDLNSVRHALRFQISQRDRIEKRISQSRKELEAEQRKMTSLSNGLQQIVNIYARTEAALANMDFMDKVKDNPIGDLFDDKDKESPSTAKLPWWSWDFGKNKWDYVKDGKYKDLGEFLDDHIDPQNPFYKKSKEKTDRFNSWVDSHRKEGDAIKLDVDFKNKKVNKVDLENEEAVKKFDEEMEKRDLSTSIKIFSVGGELFTSAFWTGGAIAGNAEGTHASATLSVSKAEVVAEAYGGLYRTDPKTGEATFKPGVGGKVGASYSIFTAEEEAQLGNKWLGGYVKSEQNVGKVGAEAEVNVGLYDKDGKFNPSIYGGVKGEAIAADITGSAGVKVLGTDVGVSGNIGFGLGGHANVGFQDGTLSLDIGGYIGVGGSISLEIDVSGTVDAVCDGAKAIWDGAGDAWDGITGWLGF